MSYYKIIDHVRYDRRMLDRAAAYVEQSPAGINLEQAKRLVASASDGYGITRIEKQTLMYIREKYQWMEEAATWFDAQQGIKSLTPQEEINEVLKAFEVEPLGVFVEAEEAIAQENIQPRRVAFKTALRLAIENILTDGKSIESPRSIVMETFGLFPDGFDSNEGWDNALTAKVKEFVLEGKMYLVERERSEEAAYFPPEDGEEVETNWIWALSLPTLSDHLFWVIIDRTAMEPPYNYGFN